MKARLFSALFFLMSVSFAFSQGLPQGLPWQPVAHSHWDMSAKKISDCEYDLIFTVTLDKGWHTFSINKVQGAEDEVFPTSITFTPNKNYTLSGAMTETKPTAEFDKTIKKTVFLHYNKAVFTQRVKLHAVGKIKITCRYDHQICSNGMCQGVPYETYDFDVTGAGCK